MKNHRLFITCLALLCLASLRSYAQQPAVIGYFFGKEEAVEKIDATKLTHIIFSFAQLKNNNLALRKQSHAKVIAKLVGLKKQNPNLKIMIALGGWGGCENCSAIFASEENRKAFASSVKKMLTNHKVDGFDMDWEYPTIEGYPGHPYKPEDKANFTAIFKTLRDTLGNAPILSFAAGGFNTFLQQAVDWKKVMPYVNFVNLMSYDLVNGNSTVTGHHTPLYSGAKTIESTDNAVQYLIKLAIPPQKIVIGAAFYARTWIDVQPVNNGLYQHGKSKSFIGYRHFPERLSIANGFNFYRDGTTKAPYAYNPVTKEFATFDDIESITAKTNYVMANKLGGIMFWELTLDNSSNGLIDAINKVKNQPNKP